MRSFSEFTGNTLHEVALEPDQKRAVFCWGRFNPPTRGHEKVFAFAKEKSDEDKASFYIFTSQTSDDDKNPLDYTRKITTLKKYFPQYSINVVQSSKINTLFDVVRKLASHDFTKATLVVGEDRLATFKEQMRKYTPDSIDIEVISAGKRSDDGTDPGAVEEVSGQMLRDFVRKGDFKSFRLASPRDAKLHYVEDTYHNIRRRYGLPSEKKNPTVEIATSEERERFFRGEFQAGDKVLGKQTNQIGEVQSVGTNYLNILFLGEEKTRRIWPRDVAKL